MIELIEANIKVFIFSVALDLQLDRMLFSYAVSHSNGFGCVRISGFVISTFIHRIAKRTVEDNGVSILRRTGNKSTAVIFARIGIHGNPCLIRPYSGRISSRIDKGISQIEIIGGIIFVKIYRVLLVACAASRIIFCTFDHMLDLLIFFVNRAVNCNIFIRNSRNTSKCKSSNRTRANQFIRRNSGTCIAVLLHCAILADIACRSVQFTGVELNLHKLLEAYLKSRIIGITLNLNFSGIGLSTALQIRSRGFDLIACFYIACIPHSIAKMIEVKNRVTVISIG